MTIIMVTPCCRSRHSWIALRFRKAGRSEGCYNLSVCTWIPTSRITWKHEHESTTFSPHDRGGKSGDDGGRRTGRSKIAGRHHRPYGARRLWTRAEYDVAYGARDGNRGG